MLTLLQVRDLKEFGLAVHKHRERDEVEDDNGECQNGAVGANLRVLRCAAHEKMS